MKLYATVTSERASKGQGGNKHIVIELRAFDRDTPIGELCFYVTDDADGKPKQYMLTWRDNSWDDEVMILREGHEDEGLIQTAELPPKVRKAKQQEGETGCMYNHDHRAEPDKCEVHN